MPYLFASITAVVCALSVGAFVFWFRQRMKNGDKEAHLTSAVNYWQPCPLHDDRLANNEIYDANRLGAEIVHGEPKRIASLVVVCCNSQWYVIIICDINLYVNEFFGK